MAINYTLPFTNREGIDIAVEILDTYSSSTDSYIARRSQKNYAFASPIDFSSVEGSALTADGSNTNFTYTGEDADTLIVFKLQPAGGILDENTGTVMPTTINILVNGVVVASTAVPDRLNGIAQIQQVLTAGDVVSASISSAANVLKASLSFTITTLVKNITLRGTGSPLVISVIDNDESKHTPIRAKQATVQFLSNSQTNLNSFANGAGDDQYKVNAKIVDPLQQLFTGFLVLNDLNQEFLDDDTNRTITLTATDGLGLLKDIALTKPDGTNPKGKFKIIEFISWCLRKTGLQLDINVMCNIMEESYQGLPAWNNIYIDAKTFEDEINTCIDCYTALERILKSFGCFLTQWRGEWWIKRIDEFEANSNYYDYYSYDGVYQGTAEGVSYAKNIGLDLPLTLIQPAAYVNLDRPHAFVKETYKYEYAKEIIDNIDFSRGDVYTPLSFPPNETWYHIEDWTFWKNINQAVTTEGIAYIRRYFEDAYEKERDIVIKRDVAGQLLIKSNPVDVGLKDKFTLSVDSRHNANVTGSGQYTREVMQVRLTGDDGTYWYLDGGGINGTVPVWVQTNSTFTSIVRYINDYGLFSEDKTQWKNTTCDAPPVPVSGSIEIVLLYSTAWGDEIHFQNLRFDYQPYINGSYQKYNGQYTKVSQTGNYKAIENDDVYLSDSPKKLFKGALFKFNEATELYDLSGRWYNGAVPSIRSQSPVEEQYLHPLGHVTAYDKWNQYRRVFRIFDCNISGLDTATETPDLLHTFFLTDTSPHTNNKRFILLHYEMDFYRCTWQGFMAEVYDDVLAKVYTDSKEFKYIENR